MEGPPVGQDWYTNLCDTGSGAGDCPRAYFLGCHQFGRTRHRLIRLDNHQDPLDLSQYCAWNKGCLEYFVLCVVGLGVGSGILTSKHTQKVRRTYGIKGNHCRDIATGIFCQPCSLIRNDLEIRRRQTDKEGHELGPVPSPPVPLGEEGFRSIHSMTVTEGYQSEPLMTTESSMEASARGSNWSSSEHIRVRVSSVANSARKSHSHPPEPVVSTTNYVVESISGSPSHPPEHFAAGANSVEKSIRGSHAHPSELLGAAENSPVASFRSSHSPPSETVVPTSTPVTASSHGASIPQYAQMFPVYPTEEEALEYERYWEESGPLPQSPQEASSLEVLDKALDTLDRRAQLLTTISEGDSLEDTRGQGKENRSQFPQIRHWLNGMGPQPNKSPIDSAVLTPGPGTSPVIHEQQNVMSQRGSPLSDTSGHHSTHEGHGPTKPLSMTKTSTIPSEPHRGPTAQTDVSASSPDNSAASSYGPQRQRSLRENTVASSSYLLVPSPSASHRQRSWQVDVSMMSSPSSQNSQRIASEVMEDVADDKLPTRVASEVPAAINSPIPLRGISPGKMFELLTIEDPEDYLVDVGAEDVGVKHMGAALEDLRASPEHVRASPEHTGASSEQVGASLDDFRSSTEDIEDLSDTVGATPDDVDMALEDVWALPEDLRVPSEYPRLPSEEIRAPFEGAGVPLDDSAQSFGSSSDESIAASFIRLSDRESARSLRFLSDRGSARSVRTPSEGLVLPLDRESVPSLRSDGVTSVGQGSNQRDTVEPDEGLPLELQSLGHISDTDQPLSQDEMPAQEEIISTTPLSTPEPQREKPSSETTIDRGIPTLPQVLTSDVPVQETQGEEPSTEPSTDHNLPTRPEVSTSDMPVQERTLSSETPVSASSKPSQSRDHSISREYHLPTPKLKGTKGHGIEMAERLPTPELTRHLGDEIPEMIPKDQPAPPKSKGWAKRAASPVFTLIRQVSFRSGKRASARSTDSTLGDERAASPSPSQRAREDTLSGDHGSESAVVDGMGQGGKARSGAARLLQSLSEGASVGEGQDGPGPRRSGDGGKSVDL